MQCIQLYWYTQTKTRETQAQPYPTDKSTRKPNVWGSVLNLGVYENLG